MPLGTYDPKASGLYHRIMLLRTDLFKFFQDLSVFLLIFLRIEPLFVHLFPGKEFSIAPEHYVCSAACHVGSHCD